MTAGALILRGFGAGGRGSLVLGGFGDALAELRALVVLSVQRAAVLTAQPAPGMSYADQAALGLHRPTLSPGPRPGLGTL